MQGLLIERRKRITENIYKGLTVGFIATSFEENPAIINENIEKGEILNQLGSGGYGNQKAITFKKTGKWLKENLPLVIARLEILKTDIEAKMAEAKKAAGTDPDEIQSSYNIKTISAMRYSWNCTYPKSTDAFNRQVESVETDESKACRLYNDLCYTWINCMEDIACCNVIINGVADKDNYELTVSQLVALGMQDSIKKGEMDDIELVGTDEEDAQTLLDKSIEDNLEKGGPGSGRKIGTTKSGKDVYSHKIAEDYKDFDIKDHTDASKLHYALEENSKGRHTKAHHGDVGDQHLEQVGHLKEKKK